LNTLEQMKINSLSLKKSFNSEADKWRTSAI
jgi:hypothetical protein